jgi:hypothetical protein
MYICFKFDFLSVIGDAAKLEFEMPEALFTFHESSIYEVLPKSNLIRVWRPKAIGNPFRTDRNGKFKLPESVVLTEASDIVACPLDSCLYIACTYQEPQSGCIWKVPLESNRPKLDSVTECVSRENWSPFSLSIKDRRLVITSVLPGAIEVDSFGNGGNPTVTVVPIESFMKPNHAVETGQRTLLVCHYGVSGSEKEASEVSIWFIVCAALYVELTYYELDRVDITHVELALRLRVCLQTCEVFFGVSVPLMLLKSYIFIEINSIFQCVILPF